MTDQIYIFDGSRKLHIDNALAVLADIQDLRPIKVRCNTNPDFVDRMVQASFNDERNQVDAGALVGNIMRSPELTQLEGFNKIVLFDKDLYSYDNEKVFNWVFGGCYSLDDGKLIALSTARLKDEVHAKDVIRHEVGHMFGAPNPARNDVYEHLGNHCGNPICVMHQRDTVEASRTAAYEQARRGGLGYCNRCEEDIRRS